MCRYDFLLFGTCGHTVVGAVVEYCEKAVAPAVTFYGGLQRTASLQDFYGTDMPSLPLFPSGGFRQLLSGPSTHAAPAPAQITQTTRRREEGIRGTNESSSLHNDAVLHHITESSRCPDDHHVGTDGRRMTSYGSTTAASEVGLPPKLMDFDTIEAEIDTIKFDVQIMRAEAESRQRPEKLSTPKQPRNPSVRVAGSKIPTPALSQVTIARAIELSKTGMANPFSRKDIPSPSTANRLNAGTGTGKIRASATAPMISPTSETSSYATCATSSYYDAVEHLQAFPQQQEAGPHFAQPTQAASRRVDETLRKDTSPAKPSPETTPGKSIKAKAPDLETNKRAAQRGRKRTSLPDGWMSSPDQTGSAERGLHKKEQILPGSGKTPTSTEQSSLGPSLRKKTSSYMSPTKAAQNRSIATIGEDKQTRKSLRMNAGALRVNTTLANKDARCRDDSSVSPKTQSSFATSKKELSSQLKNVASAKTSDGPSVVIKLPLPLPHVANTTLSPRNPNGNFLDPIGEKLGKEDLLRRDSTQDSASTRTDRISILTPVLARLNRNTTGDNNPSADPVRLAGEALRAMIQPRPRDPDNEPISQLISGLRGQSSAEIGRALAGGQHNTSSAKSVDSAETKAPVAPVVRQSRKYSDDLANLHQGRKQSVSHDTPQDPSILFRGRKPSISHDMPQDPAIAFNSGPLNHGVPADTTDQRKTSQTRSLRATATCFVPPSESDSTFQTDPALYGVEGPGGMRWPKSLDLFHEDDHVDHGTRSLSDRGFMPQPTESSLHSTWYGYKFVPWQDESMLARVFEPQSTLLRPVDLIYGDTPGDSPTSDDAFPTRVDKQDQRNPARWEIMGKGRRRYHWTGGDGLEISFKSIGPDAEHDPNSPVVYRNYRENTNTLHLEAASYPRTHAPGSPLPPNAPKLMRDYAEKMALAQIPCSSDQWTGNYDLEANVVPVPGLCGPCRQGDKLLHRVGGGIDLFR